MSGNDVGEAYLQILPSARNFYANLKSAVSPAFERSAKEASAQISDGLSKGARDGGKKASSAISSGLSDAGKSAGRSIGNDLGDGVNSGAVKAGRSGGNKLTEAFKQATRNIGEDAGKSVDLSGGMAAAGRDAGDKASGGFTSSFKSKAALGAAAAAAGVATALVAGVKGALEQKSAGAAMTAALGLKPEQSREAGKAAGDLFRAGYGDSFTDVSSAVKAVMQDFDGMKDKGAGAIKDVAGGASTIAKLFGEDVSRVTRSASQLMRNGLAPDAKTALDIVTKGMQSGANKSGDFLDSLEEYGTKFRDLGLSGQEATGLINQGLVAGARNGDIVADALKEFQIRATDGSKASAEGFKTLGLNAKEMTAQIARGGPEAKKGLSTVLDRLRAIKDPAERSAAAVKLFGTKAEDMGNALYSLRPDIAAKGLGEVAGATDRANKAMNNTPVAKFETFKRSLQQGLVDAVVKFSNVLIDNAGAIKTVAIIISPLIAGLAAYTLIVKGIAGVTRVWAGAQALLNGTLIANPIVAVIAAVVAIGAALFLAYKKSETFRNIVNGAFEVVKKAAGALARGFVDFKNQAVGVFTTVKDAVSAFGRFLGGVFGGVARKSFDVLKAALGGLRDFFAACFDRIRGILSGFGQFLSGAFNGTRRVFDGVRSALGVVRDFFGNAFGRMKDVVSDFLRFWGSVFLGAFRRVLDAVKAGLGVARDFFGNAFGRAKNFVSDFLRFWGTVFLGGVRRVLDAVKAGLGALRDFFGNAFGKIKNILGDAARYMATAFLGGVRRVFKTVGDGLNALRNFFSSIFGRIKNILGDAARYMAGAFLGGVRRVFKTVGDGLNALRSVFSSVFGKIKDVLSGFARFFQNNIWGSIKRTFEAVAGGANSLRNKFKTAVDGIGRLWDGLKALVSKPLRFIINTVLNNGLIKGLNAILPGKDIAPIKAGFASGGWTGPGRRLDPAGVVHADEFVVKKSSRRVFESNNPGVLDHINRTGEMPGYANGGLVALGRRLQSMGWRVNEHPAFGGVTMGGHRKNSDHYTGNALDVNWPGESGNNSPNEVRNAPRALAAIRAAGFGALWGPKHNHANHIHVMPLGRYGDVFGGLSGSSQASYAFDPMAALAAPFNALKSGVSGALKPIADSPIGTGAAGIMSLFATRAKDWAAGKLKEMASSFFGGGDVQSSVGSLSMGAGLARGEAQRQAAALGWTGGNWNALDWLVQHESGWNSNAKNPTSSAYGLFQFLDSTWGTVGGRKTSDTSAQISLGLKYIAQRYGNPIAAKNFWQSRSPHWYDGGGRVSPPVFDAGGILSPGLNLVHNKTGAPEPLVRPEKAYAAWDRNRGSDRELPPIVINGVDSSQAGTVANELLFALRRTQRGKY